MKRTRDLTHRQFLAALKRNGFRLMDGLWMADTTGVTTAWFGTVYRQRDGKIMRRASLAKAVRDRDAAEARIERERAAKADLDRILDEVGM